MNTIRQSIAGKRPKLRRQLLTPEGVPLNIELASVGDRFGALLLDLFFMTLGILAVSLIGYFVYHLGPRSDVASSIAKSMLTLLFFLVRSFYFIFFELRWHGQTPGKRITGLRVIDRHGGPLNADAIFARNMMRELELFLPLTALVLLNFYPAPRWSPLFLCVWLLILAFLPVFNRQKMRAGDMVGGTWVVRAPRQTLLKDLIRANAPTPGIAHTRSQFVFTTKQLDAYGIYELQTLEDVLRHRGQGTDETLKEVTRRIARKINWTTPVSRNQMRAFLTDFYGALRQHLEARALFGDRKQDKHDTSGRPIGPRA